MIANKNDHEFISVVDLKNIKGSLAEASTTDYRSKEATGTVESPCVASMKASGHMKLTQSSSLPMTKALQKSKSTKLTNNLNAFQDKVVALMHQVSQSRVSPKVQQMKGLKQGSQAATPKTSQATSQS